jgi:hypothetical protein
MKMELPIDSVYFEKNKQEFGEKSAKRLAIICPICDRPYGLHDDGIMNECFPALVSGYREYVKVCKDG